MSAGFTIFEDEDLEEEIDQEVDVDNEERTTIADNGEKDDEDDVIYLETRPLDQAARIEHAKSKFETRLPQPIKFNCEQAEQLCSFCQITRPIAFLGENGINRAPNEQSERETNLCTSCTQTRSFILRCQGHKLQAVPEPSISRYNEMVQGLLVEGVAKVSDPWCTACFGPAAFTCIEPQNILIPEHGCGLNLCRSCAQDYEETYASSWMSFVFDLPEVATSKRPFGTRADLELLRPEGALDLHLQGSKMDVGMNVDFSNTMDNEGNAIFGFDARSREPGIATLETSNTTFDEKLTMTGAGATKDNIIDVESERQDTIFSERDEGVDGQAMPVDEEDKEVDEQRTEIDYQVLDVNKHFSAVRSQGTNNKEPEKSSSVVEPKGGKEILKVNDQETNAEGQEKEISQQDAKGDKEATKVHNQDLEAKGSEKKFNESDEMGNDKDMLAHGTVTQVHGVDMDIDSGDMGKDTNGTSVGGEGAVMEGVAGLFDHTSAGGESALSEEAAELVDMADVKNDEDTAMRDAEECSTNEDTEAYGISGGDVGADGDQMTAAESDEESLFV